MAIVVKHPFVSAKGDGSDATLVRPSNWNANHTIEQATNTILGRLTAGPGATEELPVTSFMMALLNTADLAALSLALGLPTTGDARLTYKTTAPIGWIFANDGTIGNTTSGASYVPPTYSTSALFTHFYNAFSDAVCPLQTSTGIGTTRVAQGTAAVAFTANCRMVIPKNLGRALIGAGAGAGLTSRPLATSGGLETYTLLLADIPKHTHSASNWALSSGAISGTQSGSSSITLSGADKTGFPDSQHNHAVNPPNTGSSGNIDAGYDLTHAHGGVPTNSGYTSGGFVGSAPSISYANFQSPGNTGNSSSLNHAHNTDIGNLTTTAEAAGSYGDGTHKHSMAGTYNGSCSINTWTSLTVSGTVSGTTSVMATGDGAHTNMQPWTAWNIMIRL